MAKRPAQPAAGGGEMVKVTVVAAQGVTLRGPVRLGLTDHQHDLRAGVLGARREDGVYQLDGGQSVSFKCGEVLGVAQPQGRLNPLLVSWDEPVATAETEAVAEGAAGEVAA